MGSQESKTLELSYQHAIRIVKKYGYNDPSDLVYANDIKCFKRILNVESFNMVFHLFLDTLVNHNQYPNIAMFILFCEKMERDFEVFITLSIILEILDYTNIDGDTYLTMYIILYNSKGALLEPAHKLDLFRYIFIHMEGEQYDHLKNVVLYSNENIQFLLSSCTNFFNECVYSERVILNVLRLDFTLDNLIKIVTHNNKYGPLYTPQTIILINKRLITAYIKENITFLLCIDHFILVGMIRDIKESIYTTMVELIHNKWLT